MPNIFHCTASTRAQTSPYLARAVQRSLWRTPLSLFGHHFRQSLQHSQWPLLSSFSLFKIWRLSNDTATEYKAWPHRLRSTKLQRTRHVASIHSRHPLSLTVRTRLTTITCRFNGFGPLWALQRNFKIRDAVIKIVVFVVFPLVKISRLRYF